MIRAFLVLCTLTATPAQAAFHRVVSLNPVVSEWVAEILGERDAMRVLVGVSEYSNYPNVLQKIEKIGPYPQLNIEKIAGLKPDLVLASEEYNRPEQLEQLRRLKLPLKVLSKETFHSMPEWILSLGSALQEVKKAARARNRWVNLKASLGAETQPSTRVFIEVQHQPLISVGSESFLTEALLAVGYQNIFSNLKSGYPKVSLEAVIKADPERIFILDHVGDEKSLNESKKDWARFRTLSAVKSAQISLISGDDFARCSLRLLNALKRLRSKHEERNP